jgi:hypothetical protein
MLIVLMMLISMGFFFPFYCQAIFSFLAINGSSHGNVCCGML